MTAYTTCTGCAVNRHKCEHRKKIRAAIVGLHMTSLKFSCPDRVPRFRPGQRVTVMWKLRPDTGDGEFYDLEEVLFKATILKEPKPGRFHIKVDDGPCHCCEDDPEYWIAPDCLIGNGYASATYGRLEALDEPDVPICAHCGGLGVANDCWFDARLKGEGCLLAEGKQ